MKEFMDVKFKRTKYGNLVFNGGPDTGESIAGIEPLGVTPTRKIRKKPKPRKIKGDERMEYGIVRFFNDQKGWGFIDIEGSDESAFVHYSAIQGEGFKSLDEGQRVSLDLEKSEKGIAAVNVSVIHE